MKFWLGVSLVYLKTGRRVWQGPRKQAGVKQRGHRSSQRCMQDLVGPGKAPQFHRKGPGKQVEGFQQGDVCGQVCRLLRGKSDHRGPSEEAGWVTG